MSYVYISNEKYPWQRFNLDRSFLDVRTWFSNIEQHASEGVNKILIGNKCDMTDKKVSWIIDICKRKVTFSSESRFLLGRNY
jgi:GTPase SAR1 family protein